MSAILAALAGCPPEPAPVAPVATRVRVQSFTDATAVRGLVSADPYVFVATDAGLDRWDLRSGKRLHWSAEHGLPGNRVQSLDHDASRDWLWVATDGGLSRYDIAAATFTEVPAPPGVLGLTSFEGAVVESAGDGGAWLGVSDGLFYASTEGGWKSTGVTENVTGLHRDRGGTLWIGTERGVFMVGADRVARRLRRAEGCDLARVEFLTDAPAGPIAVGEETGGDDRVVFLGVDGCRSYRPSRPWRAATRQGARLVVLVGRRLYAMGGDASGVRRLERDGARLVPMRGGGESISLRPVKASVPPGAVDLAAAGDEILIGTRSLGTVRIPAHGRRHAESLWLRRRELAGGASSLTVACAARDDCYVATGTRHLWRFDGHRFVDVGDGEDRFLAVARARDGAIYAVREGGEARGMRVAVAVDGGFEDVPELVIETPGKRSGLAFARFSPAGVLWLGLSYEDDTGETRPYGVALVDIALSVVAYHHASVDETERKQGVLPIPVGAVAASFLGAEETWLATSQGAARVVDEEVDVYTEADGLRAEFLRGVACSAGTVYVASGQGVGAFDGEVWRYERILRRPVNDIEVGADGRLWMATNRGLAAFDGGRVRRLDARRGLIENQIDEVEIDHLGRVWLLGSQGLGLVTP